MRHAVLALGLLASPAAAEATLAEASLGLELVPCALSDLSCVTLPLPLDPRANDPEKTIDITFALSFAHVESRGILFYVVGGPGGSGLASAEGYLSAFNPSLTDYMDIVFIDQRGGSQRHVGRARQGSLNQFSVKQDDYVITALGEAPPEAVQAIATSVTRR